LRDCDKNWQILFGCQQQGRISLKTIEVQNYKNKIVDKLITGINFNTKGKSTKKFIGELNGMFIVNKR